HERAQAYRAVLTENGLPVIEPLLGSWSEAWGHDAVAKLFDGNGEKPDAVFCGNDQIARGVIDALRERGLGVPSDVGVIGFD
ncbi:MAG: LacI family transcriptional regulator, partial [Mesorhizobium sp.]